MRAEDGARTRHLKLGRLPLYQMSYFRKSNNKAAKYRYCERYSAIPVPCSFAISPVHHRGWGEEDSNLRRLRQQIYSLPHLTALVSPRDIHQVVNW